MFNFFVIKIIDITADYVLSFLNGNRLVEERMLKIVDGIKIFTRYVNRKISILHKAKVTENIKKYYEMVTSASINHTNATENKIDKLIYYMLSLLLGN